MLEAACVRHIFVRHSFYQAQLLSGTALLDTAFGLKGFAGIALWEKLLSDTAFVGTALWGTAFGFKGFVGIALWVAYPQKLPIDSHGGTLASG